MHKLLEKLGRDHRNLEKILEMLTNQLDNFYAGKESNFDLKIELMEYLEAFADKGHHPLENIIYAVGMERAPERRELFERLCHQHQDLNRLTSRFRHSLEGVLHEAVISRAELETQGREFIALQHLHLDLEDREVFPLLEATLTEDDWKRLETSIPRHDDPVFETPDRIRFQNLVAFLAKEG
jgi:hemerythrin-like domain-containing protein